MTTAKRVYLYLVSLVALGLMAFGSARLLGLLFNLLGTNQAISSGRGFNSGQFSLGLAMILIGGGLWWGFWRSIQKSVAVTPAEIGAPFRKLYLNFIQTAAALVGLLAAVGSLNWILDGARSIAYPPVRLATVLVAAAVWYYHWRLSEKEGQPTSAARTLRRWYIYIVSAWGLVMLSVNIVRFIGNSAYFLPVWEPALVHSSFWHAVSGNISGAFFGGLAWGFFWFKMARGDTDSTLRQIYYYLLAIPGGAIAGLVALTTTLYWCIGYVAGLPSTASSYFQFLNWTLPSMIVAAAVWFYHQRLAQEEATATEEKHLSARRVHLYLMSFISLGTMVAGLVVLIGILLDLLITAVGGDVIAGTPGWWRGQLSLSLALLVVGVPIWMYFWGSLLKILHAGGAAERRARSRRIFLYVVIGLSILSAVAALVNLVYLLINAMLQGGSTDLARSIKWSIQSLAVTAPLLLYFWNIIKSDQRFGAEAVATQKNVTVVAPESASGFIERLEAGLGYRVKVLRSLADFRPAHEPESNAELDVLISQIQSAPGNKVLLVMEASGWSLIPYQER